MSKRPDRIATAHRGRRRPAGNFHDLDLLLDQLGSPPVFELGKPAPDERYLPGPVGSCPAAHNRALIGEDAA